MSTVEETASMGEVRAIISSCLKRSPNDIPAAVAGAVKKLQKTGLWQEAIEELAMRGIYDIAYDVRETDNKRMRRSGGLSVPRSQPLGRCVVEAYSLYLYNIAGRTLGSLAYEELEDLAAIADAKAATSTAEAQMLRRLKETMRPGQTVENVSEDRVRKIFSETVGRVEA